jgi:hypothetical protein
LRGRERWGSKGKRCPVLRGRDQFSEEDISGTARKRKPVRMGRDTPCPERKRPDLRGIYIYPELSGRESQY